MGLGVTAAALIFLQAAPVPRVVFPWEGQVQVLMCKLVSKDATVEDYVLTISDSHAFIVGQAPSQSVQMEMFVPFESLPPVIRGQALVRRFQFTAGDQTASVRQLYQAGHLKSTFIVSGSNASDIQDLPFEAFAAFCAPAQRSREVNQ